MYSAMALISKLCGKVEPKDVNLIKYSTELAALLDSDDEKIVESVLRCFSTLVDRFVRKQIDLIGLATSNNLVETLLNFLCDSSVHQVENSLNETFSSATSNQNESASNNLQKNRPSSNKYALVPIIVPLLCNLCKVRNLVSNFQYISLLFL
jgi:E3 ubiquitin-protein ligase HECTD1